jgi:DNA repair exonuclease SbcCD ATPase subunit
MNEELKPCPNCGNVGWYAVQRPNRNTGDAEWEQEQCEFCYTEPNSVFNVISSLRSQLAEAQAEIKRLTEEPKLCPFCGGKLYTFAEIVELKTEIANLLSEIAGLRAKHNDYEHPQDSIDRGNRIDQLEIDKFNLKTELKRLQTGVQNILDRRDLLDRYEIASMLADIVKVFP